MRLARALGAPLAAANRTIITNAGAVAATTVVTSILGFAYWWIAAHLFPPEAVGFAGAGVSAMTLLGSIGALGCGTLLISELGRRPGEEGTAITTALVLTALVGCGFGAIFALIAPGLSPELAPLRESIAGVLLFSLGVSLVTCGSVLDQALLGLLRGGWQFWRNTIYAAVKLILLVLAASWLASRQGLTMYGTWVFGNAISLIMLLGLATWQHGRLPIYKPRWTLVRQFRSTALRHHALNLALQGSGYALPLLVTATLSAKTNAYFVTAWMVAGFVFVGPLALTTALYAVGARSPVALAQRIRFTLSVAIVGGLLANVSLIFGAHVLLSIFGREYAERAAGPLRVIGLGVFAIVIKDHYVAIHRIRDRVARASLLVSIGGTIELILAAVGARLGDLTGLAIGWLLAGVLQATFMAPAVYRAARPHPGSTEGQRDVTPLLQAGELPVPRETH